MEDHMTHGGVCRDSIGDFEYGWPVSATSCEGQGLCREETEEALNQCWSEISRLPFNGIQRNIEFLIASMCSDVSYGSTTKLNPLGPLISNQYSGPQFENTQGRYPWLCSLRGRQDRKHYCGATILSRPPGPLVIVTAAHCVFLCKSPEGETLPNCCCENVSGSGCTADSGIQCGLNATTAVMTGEDAEIICGEWETGNYTAEESGEEYNIILEIESINVHPDYNITRGVNNSQYVIADVATFKVREDLSEEQTSLLTPVCLPQAHTSTFGVHAGWSSPPPDNFLAEKLPGFDSNSVREFGQLWHYNMSLITCQDPTKYFVGGFFGYATGEDLTYSTNSYYPPGTICALEKNHEFCPTSGESGSPLMVQDEEGLFYMLGINSFLKGCASLSTHYNQYNNEGDYEFVILKQFSDNPSVYSRLSCFLPWIAEQYGLTYTPSQPTEPECEQGVGNIDEVTAEVCRATPDNRLDVEDKLEPPCILPFTLNNEEYDQCALVEIGDFTKPQFFCPIRTIKGRGTNYTTADVDAFGYCPTNSIGYNYKYNGIRYTFSDEGEVTNEYNGQWELDPDNTWCLPVDPSPWQEQTWRPVFATCKNTCPGGETFYYHLVVDL